MTKHIVFYGAAWCPDCRRAKAWKILIEPSNNEVRAELHDLEKKKLLICHKEG